MSKEENVKYILLLGRDLYSNEKQELKRWFKVFSYTKKTANDRTVNELLNDYDVIALSIYDSEHKQFYAESIKLLEGEKNILRVFVGKLEETKDDKEDIINAWKIDYFVKKIPVDTESKDQFLHKILCVLLPKPKKRTYKEIIFGFVSQAVMYLIPKFCS